MLYAGIVPYINASIILQLLTTSFPSLKKLQREEGPQGRARFQLYQKLAALGFAVAQSVGQLTYIRPYVSDFSTDWLITNSVTLTAGAMILVHVSFLLDCSWCLRLHCQWIQPGLARHYVADVNSSSHDPCSCELPSQTFCDAC